MERWEYIVEPWKYAITGVDSPELEEKLNSLGQEGWELINIIPQVGGMGNTVSVDFNHLVFKRKIE
ncbi:DUF4177 domain-containing protein [Lentibacillus sp. Marseille-P4043]|uniref:DUF4177 domain-containing protein n=1 Tax=Lentibacillus sp. Marseille-P4043 TaxID=2040293 RepID=UPI000D0BB84C|nr:DUF4177 domain-containing protein [Lentibacillus sp. Marseille-P4043]